MAGHFQFVIVAVALVAAACEKPEVTGLRAKEAGLPMPELPIRVPEGARLTDQFNPFPGTPSFYVQLHAPGGVDAAGEFFRAEFRRLGMKELEAPNPQQARGVVVRLVAESQKARVAIMIVKHPVERGSDIDIRWEEPPT